jgi:hypothetical protein
MKWLFFILLLVNIGLFVWSYPQGDEPEPEFVRPTGVQSLILLSELGDAPVVMPKTPTTEPDPDPAADVPSLARQVAPPPSAKPAVKPEAQEPKKAESKTTERESPDDRAAAIPAEQTVQPLNDTVLTEEKADQPNIEPEPTKPPVLHCSRIGPVGKRVQADQLSLRLITLGLQPELISELSNEQQGYWVLVPPQKNRKTAVKIVRQLRKAGVSDLWRFTSGKLAHAISLGLFKGKARAEIRRKEIADKGFDVEVRPRYRQITRYWQSINYAGESPITQDKWLELVERYPGIEQEETDCQEIASH